MGSKAEKLAWGIRVFPGRDFQGPLQVMYVYVCMSELNHVAVEVEVDGMYALRILSRFCFEIPKPKWLLAGTELVI